ncbi:MAG: BlaI/MecI/CopY family transcriptional regulator [Taibaiella sp.]|nr:BlaI/MecI/CopY family transcriptional regulator [Taibaiella sp.]
MEQLTKTEEQIMQVIWKLERCLVKDIIDELGIGEIPHSTISSVVRILEKKGFVDHKAYGKTHEYFPVVAKEAYSKRGLKSWIKDYFNGSPKQLVSFLVENNELNVTELNQLLKKLDAAKDKK